jgi:Leucine-rich repeat (LRR) protein
MAIAQHRPVPTRQEQTNIHWQTESMSPRSTTMSNRVYQPLIFSIDDRLADQHLTKLDLCSKNLKKIDKLPNNINFNVVLLDYNDITKVEHLDSLTHLIQVRIFLSISSEILLYILVINFS